MAALCLDERLETLRPVCCSRTPRLYRNLHKGFPQVVQAVVKLPAHHFLQNSPQFIVQGFEICIPRKPILGDDEDQRVPPQPLLRYLVLSART